MPAEEGLSAVPEVVGPAAKIRRLSRIDGIVLLIIANLPSEATRP